MRRYPENGGQFAIIPVELLYEDSVPATAKLLYGEIYRLSNADGWCDTSNKDFCELLGCGENTVRNLLKALARVGQISIHTEPRHGETGGTIRRIFCGRRLAVPDEGGCPQKIGGSTPKNLEGAPPKICGDTYKKSNNKNIPPIVPQGTDAQMLFERFWKAYPKKRDKERARRAWKRLNPDLELCQIMAGALERQKRSDQWIRDGGAYIPHPSTWLNGRRWEDEPDKPPNPEPTAPKERRYGWY